MSNLKLNINMHRILYYPFAFVFLKHLYNINLPGPGWRDVSSKMTTEVWSRFAAYFYMTYNLAKLSLQL
jgi:hypothetical protein